ncbi:MAG: hypothetical protein WB493_00370 [Anaeromyxobacteraceae bacterium]
MTVRTEFPASIPAPTSRRNPSPAFPALDAFRARKPRAGLPVAAVVWMAALAFFVLAVAAPAAVLERRAAGSPVVASARP